MKNLNRQKNRRHRLAEAGFMDVRRGDAELLYVLTVVYDPELKMVVGLLKTKGPEFLHGKLTFPGGRIEAGETPETAGSRELMEETGLLVPESAWKFVARNAKMAVFTAPNCHVLSARTLTDEKVYPMSVPRQIEYAQRRPEAYAPDFIVLLAAAISVLKA